MGSRISQLGTFKVEQVRRAGFGAAQTKPARVVQHTTEGGFEGSFAKLSRIDTPTFLLGRDGAGKLRCVQFLELGVTAGALEHPPGTRPTNSLCVAQIELVGFSQRTAWLPDPGVTDLLAHLYAELHKRTGVPLVHVAANRNRAIFESHAGFYGHGDVPDQPTGHWDPGKLEYATLFAAAKRLLEAPAWLAAASAASPLWAWMIWRDNGAPVDLRPANVPARIPASWWTRYLLHRGL